MEQRETFVADSAISIGDKFHTKIFYFIIVWFCHHPTLTDQQITQPAKMVFTQLTIDKTETSTTGAPRCLQHQTGMKG